MYDIAIVGAGDIARHHAAAYAALPQVKITAIADIRIERARAMAATCGGRPVTRLEDILDQAPDIIAVCTPDHLHAPQTIECLEAGANVLCEKPIALNLTDARGVMHAAAESTGACMIGHVLRFSPAYRFVYDTVTSGDLGAPLSVSATRLNPYPHWREWFDDPQQGGGAVIDLMIHDVDFCAWLLGPVESVASRGAPNHVQTLLSFASGVTGAMEASYRMPPGYPPAFFLRIVCEDGVIEYDNRARAVVRVFHPDREQACPKVSEVDPFVEEIRSFVHAVEAGSPPAIPVGDAAYALEVVLAAADSLRGGGCRVTVERKQT